MGIFLWYNIIDCKGINMAKSMYDIIKKQNGEHFAKAIRNYDNGIFDVPNIDKIVKYAGPDAEPIMNYLVSLKNIQIEEHAVHQDPIKLLDKAGYNAYIADTLKKQNAIKKYYASGEELCTFGDPDRFKKYYIINAVRKDVDKIKREKIPTRDGEYGTSVISIQVLKTGGFISIKNRYNHTVDAPDNTLNSNPDSIIPGLADAIKHHFDVDFSSRQVQLYGNYTLIDNQIYHYKGELNNVYWSENSYVKDGHIVEIDKGSQIMLGDGLLFDFKQKEIRNLTSWGANDFSKSLNHAIENKTLQIAKNPQGGHDIFADKKRILTVENAEIVNINIPDAHTIKLHNSNLRGDLDFSGVKELTMDYVDFSNVPSLKMPKNAEAIGLFNTQNFPQQKLDFSNTQRLSISNSDLTRVTEINLPQDAQHITFIGTQFPACDLIFGSALSIDLSNSDLSRVTNLKLPTYCADIRLIRTQMPACDLDFKYIHSHYLAGADLSRVRSLKNISTKQDLIDIKFPACDLDFSKFSQLTLARSDLSRATSIKFPQQARLINLENAILPACELDFQNPSHMHTTDTDFSRVINIKNAPTNAQMKFAIEKLKRKTKIIYPSKEFEY